MKAVTRSIVERPSTPRSRFIGAVLAGVVFMAMLGVAGWVEGL